MSEEFEELDHLFMIPFLLMPNKNANFLWYLRRTSFSFQNNSDEKNSFLSLTYSEKKAKGVFCR
jgi:hypothetical protein